MRRKLINELNARENIKQQLLKEIREDVQNNFKTVQEREYLRRYIRSILIEAKVADKVPHSNTGINVLQDLLKKIIKIIEIGYKTLTTDPKQRKSFRAHILNAVKGAIAPPNSLNRAEIEQELGHKTKDLDNLDLPDSPQGDDSSLYPEPEYGESPIEDSELDIEEPEEEEEEEELGLEPEPISLQESIEEKILRSLKEIKVDLKDGGDKEDLNDPVKARSNQDGIIDIDNDGKGVEEVDPKEDFTISTDQDMTGRNVAYETFQKIENNIIDAYSLLNNNVDLQMFYKYFLINLMLYFERFEKELQENLEEPGMEQDEIEQIEQNSVNPSGDQIDLEDIT